MNWKAVAVVLSLVGVMPCTLQAGGVMISIGARPAPAYCARPPFYCAPVVYYPCTWAIPWGVSYIDTSAGFTNVSSLFAGADSIPVVRVPPPITAIQPVKVYPESTFGWRH